MDLTAGAASPAAYHGTGWRPRLGSLREDLSSGAWWRTAGSDSECGTLRAVLLATPPPGWPPPADWNEALYLGPVDFDQLRRELAAYADLLTGLGVEVSADVLPAAGPAGSPLYNGFFVRDQFFTTPEGAIVSRMGSATRAAEEARATAALAGRGMPIVRTVRGNGCFEGADALWLRPDLVAIGIGNRTNTSGAEQVSALLAEQGVSTSVFALPAAVQHLLGLLQIVAPDLAFLRGEHAPAGLQAELSRVGIETVHVPESPAVTTGQAFNIVTVTPRRIVMPDGWPAARRLFEQHDVEVVGTVDCPHLVRCAGGLACATGILHRQLLGSAP